MDFVLLKADLAAALVDYLNKKLHNNEERLLINGILESQKAQTKPVEEENKKEPEVLAKNPEEKKIIKGK